MSANHRDTFKIATEPFDAFLTLRVLPVLLFGMILLPGILQAQEKPADKPLVDFDKQIKPIFEKHCIECHGQKAPEGGLRLNSRKAALAEVDSGHFAIVPGHAEKSTLIQRIRADDEDERMPPDAPLSDLEIQLLNRWINQGAKWSQANAAPTHWAYQKPLKPKRPSVQNRQWPKGEIDYFVLNRMESKGFHPSDRETPARLIRRLYFALTGLPPDPQTVREFEKNPTDQAYQEIVDRLLASPRFGEHFARSWLDLARYADSNGFQADQLRDSWAYRDWVINAINRDMPFDQFMIEQLAGDLLPNATSAQKIATGFHRAAACNVEAGVHPEQNRINQIFDRVNTTGTVFLGATIECAQCHNHKYDPISQDEYYQLFAFFNNTPVEVKLESGVQYNFYGPSMELPLPVEKVARRKTLLDERESLKQQLTRLRIQHSKNRAEWELAIQKSQRRKADWKPLAIEHFESNGGETIKKLSDHSILVGGSLPGTSIYEVRSSPLKQKVAAIRFEALTHQDIPGKGPGRGDEVRTNFILSEFIASYRTGSDWKSIPLSNPVASFEQNGWPAKNSIDENRKTGWAIAPQFGKNHWIEYQLQKPIMIDGPLKFSVDQNYGRGRTIGRFRILVSSQTSPHQNLPPAIRRILSIKKRNPAQQKRLDAFYENNHPEMGPVHQRLGQLEKELAQLKPDSTLVMVEMSKERDTRKLIRGDYLNPGKKVSPGTPSVLHAFSDQYQKNRLGFARWLASNENPLTPRVTANRIWAHFFGNGIVSSLEDLGVQSESPSHPRLLDYLSTRLIELRWSRKKLVREFVLSETFRQSSKLQQEHLRSDLKNRWLSRGPRIRMSAEMIRDNALSVSGLMHHQLGGKPVMPFQPPQIWRAVGRNAPQWKEAKDEQRYRRGIYVVWRRAAPYPSFVNFDAPDRAACVVKRSSTNTPLQALTLLNDLAYVEAAIAFADAELTNNRELSKSQRVSRMFRRCVSRSPNENEIHIVCEMLKRQQLSFKENPGKAKQLFSQVSHLKTEYRDQAELAAWAMVASALLNLDESIHY